jgi:hypothetical protein
MSERLTLLAYKTASESITASTTYQDDDDLFLPVRASAIYQAQLHVVWTSGTTPDFKIQATVPTGATTTGWTYILNGNINDWVPTVGLTAIAGTGAQESFDATGLVIVATTAGTVQWQWAQNTSDAGATSVGIGSFFTLERMA